MNIGVLGAGQLAQMLALAAVPLGHHIVCLDPSSHPCAKNVAPVITARFDDLVALQQFASQVDVITFETENIPSTTLDFCQTIKPVSPSQLALRTCQDRLLEKEFCQALGIPTADYWVINNFNDLEAAVAICHGPCILKTRRFGYDGKGQISIPMKSDLHAIWETCSKHNLILERKILFDRELACLGVRDHTGRCQIYPLTENQHIEGILHLSMPVESTDALEQQAHEYFSKLMQAFDYIGILAIEMFQVDDHLIVNEIAPRVHNSGHWTIEGAAHSQFNNHIRAITHMPLGECSPIGYNAMINAISTMPDIAALSKIPCTHWHDYGKTPRLKRKLGHATLHCSSREALQEYLSMVLKISPFDRR